MTRPPGDRRAPGAPYRLPRALSAGALCGPGGAAAHVLAGGAAPSALALALVTAAALGGAALAGRRRLGPVALLLLAGGAQLVFHQTFGAAADPTAHGATHGMTHTAGAETTMLLAHAGTALLVAAVAGGAEASWWALARAALLRLLPAPPATPVAVPATAPRPRVTARRGAAPVSAESPEVVGPRGPPVRTVRPARTLVPA